LDVGGGHATKPFASLPKAPIDPPRGAPVVPWLLRPTLSDISPVRIVESVRNARVSPNRRASVMSVQEPVGAAKQKKRTMSWRGRPRHRPRPHPAAGGGDLRHMWVQGEPCSHYIIRTSGPPGTRRLVRPARPRMAAALAEKMGKIAA